MQPDLTIAGVLGVTIVIAAAIWVYGRVRIERERTLQHLIARGMAPDDLARIVGADLRRQLDLRRGVLLLAVGVAWTGVTYAVGGKAWTLGAGPIALGVAYVVVWGVHGRGR